MTQMQQFDGTEHITMYHEPERTSIAAILGLVCSCIGCCFGVTAIIGIFLSIFGIVGISRSKGRVGGMGFAIAGLLVGLLMAALWAGILGMTNFGMGWMRTSVAAPTVQILQHIEAGEFDEARLALGAPASLVPDDVMVEFRDGYMSSLGGAVAEPGGLGELFEGYGAIGQQIQNYNGRPNHIPVPAMFDRGYGLLVVEMDPNLQGNANTMDIVPIRIFVVDADGNEYVLPPHGWVAPQVDSSADDMSGVDVEEFSDDGDDSADDTPGDDGP